MSESYDWRGWPKPVPTDPDGIYLKPHYSWGEMWVKIGSLVFWAEMGHVEHLEAIGQSALNVYEARHDYRRRNPWRYVQIVECGVAA